MSIISAGSAQSVPQPRALVVGTGAAGAVHANAIRASGGDLAWVVGSTPAKSLAGARALRSAAADRVEDVLDQVDVVHICTPNDSHASLAMAAVEAGRHVVSELPLGLEPGQARELRAAADRAGIVAVTSLPARFYPMVRLARRRVRSGQTGPLHLLHGVHLQDQLSDPHAMGWRVDVGRTGPSRAFDELGGQWCDLIEFVTGHRIAEVQASLLVAFPDRVVPGSDGHLSEDAATVMFRTDRGALGNLVVSQASPGSKDVLRFTISGEVESLGFDQETSDRLEVGSRDVVQVLRRGAEVSRYSSLGPGRPQGYQHCVDALVADAYAAIHGARPDGLPTFADGVRVADLTHAVLTSHATRSWVPVEPESTEDEVRSRTSQSAVIHP